MSADDEWKRVVGDVVKVLQGLQGTEKTDPAAKKGWAPQKSMIGRRKHKQRDDDKGQGNNATPSKHPLHKSK